MLNDHKQLTLFDADDQARQVLDDAAPAGKYGNYVVYVDESGDHGMQTIDSQYPVFVLAFCVFHKRHYCEKVVPTLQKFKFAHFGHDFVVLHETEIRKEIAPFNFFVSRHHKHTFIDELSHIMEAINFVLISCVIRQSCLEKQRRIAAESVSHRFGFLLRSFI